MAGLAHVRGAGSFIKRILSLEEAQGCSADGESCGKKKRRDMVEEIFNKTRNIYGYRKTAVALRARGIECSPNTVLADYKDCGLKSLVKKKHRICTTDSNHSNPVAENVLDRNFKTERPNEKWVTDITYVETAEVWLFVVAIIDLFSRKVIGDLPSRH